MPKFIEIIYGVLNPYLNLNGRLTKSNFHHLTCYRRNSWLFYACHRPHAVFSRDGEHPGILSGVPREADDRPVKGSALLTELNNATLAPRAIQRLSECEIPRGLSGCRRSFFLVNLVAITNCSTWPRAFYIKQCRETKANHFSKSLVVDRTWSETRADIILQLEAWLMLAIINVMAEFSSF